MIPIPIPILLDKYPLWALIVLLVTYILGVLFCIYFFVKDRIEEKKARKVKRKIFTLKH